MVVVVGTPLVDTALETNDQDKKFEPKQKNDQRMEANESNEEHAG